MDEKQVKQLVSRALIFETADGPLFAPLSKATAGTPVLVRDTFKAPSYWLVPLLTDGRLGGYARVLMNGTIAHFGTFYRATGELQDAPSVITGITDLEASSIAAERVHSHQGELAAAPVFVHDGPIGREAWLVEVSKEGIPIRWLFVTPNFVYERPAGQVRSDDLE